ncbi:integrase [Daphnia sinensis]|uniref:Integrase n=1 Tax=Daphnia sinensis TaxID=1820382 RepID=A0AAD5PRL3_9CRUS|nr:integrase [Daphnia sinensis]
MVVREVKKTKHFLEALMIHHLLEELMQAIDLCHILEDEVMPIVETEVLEIEVYEVIVEECRTIKLNKGEEIKLKLINNMLLISKTELVTTVMPQVISVEIVVTERKKLKLMENLLKPGSQSIGGIKGVTVKMLGEGDVVFESELNGVNHHLTIQHVLFAPDLGINMFSIAAVTNLRWDVHFIRCEFLGKIKMQLY